MVFENTGKIEAVTPDNAASQALYQSAFHPNPAEVTRTDFTSPTPISSDGGKPWRQTWGDVAPGFPTNPVASKPDESGKPWRQTWGDVAPGFPANPVASNPTDSGKPWRQTWGDVAPGFSTNPVASNPTDSVPWRQTWGDVAPIFPTNTVAPAANSPFDSVPANPVASVANSSFESVPTNPVTPVESSAFAPVSSSPFAPVSSSPFAPVSSSPFAPVSSSPFAPVSSSPFAPVSSSPFAPVSSSPFAPVSSSPFAPVSSSPFAPVSSSPFAPVSSSPFAPVSSSPFAPVSSSPFAPVSSNPFSPSQGSDNSSGPAPGKSAVEPPSPWGFPDKTGPGTPGGGSDGSSSQPPVTQADALDALKQDQTIRTAESFNNAVDKFKTFDFQNEVAGDQQFNDWIATKSSQDSDPLPFMRGTAVIAEGMGKFRLEEGSRIDLNSTQDNKPRLFKGENFDFGSEATDYLRVAANSLVKGQQYVIGHKGEVIDGQSMDDNYIQQLHGLQTDVESKLNLVYGAHDINKIYSEVREQVRVDSPDWEQGLVHMQGILDALVPRTNDTRFVAKQARDVALGYLAEADYMSSQDNGLNAKTMYDGASKYLNLSMQDDPSAPDNLALQQIATALKSQIDKAVDNQWSDPFGNPFSIPKPANSQIS